MSGIASSLAVENQPREQLSHEQMLAVQSQMCQLKTSIEALKVRDSLQCSFSLIVCVIASGTVTAED